MKRIRALIVAAILLLGSVPAWAEQEAAQITLSARLKVIGEEAFMGIPNVSEVKVPARVTTIGDRAFKDMSALAKIEIPRSVKSIGSGILDGAMDAVLVDCAPDSAAMTYALANNLDFDADTTCRALLIGNTYADTENSLEGPDYDVYGLEATLNQLSGRSFQVTKGINVTAARMGELIDEAFAGAKDQDISLFYYSGHGSESGDLISNDIMLISPEVLRDKLDTIPGRKILLIDACYSGNFIKDDAVSNNGALSPEAGLNGFQSAFLAAFEPKADRNSAFNPSDYFVMTAARYDQPSISLIYTSGKAMGIFTWKLCEGLGYNYYSNKSCAMSADVDGDAAVSMQEAAVYVYDNVEAFYESVGWNMEDMQLVQVYPENCLWFAPFRQ